MLRIGYRRWSRTRWLRALALVLVVILFIDLLSVILTRRSQSEAHKTIPNVKGQKIFIASIHWNNEIILRSNWNDQVVNLIKYFGADNVYISIYESGSYLDDTKGALRELDDQLEELGVKRTIILDETTHADEMQKPVTEGWIDTPRRRKELRRIPYLARLRNISLEPLHRMVAEGVKYDKVLFLNDVVFSVSSLLPGIILLLINASRLRMLPIFWLHETAITPQLAPWTSPNPLNTMTPSLCAIAMATRQQRQVGRTFDHRRLATR